MDFQDWRLFGLITTLFIVYLIAIQNPLTYMFFSLYWEHKVIQATSVQRPKSVFIEWILQWQLCKCKSCPLCATQYIRFQIYNLIEFWNPSFYKKRLGPHAGPHHFINARFLVNQFFRVFLERLMLQHVINEIPLGTSFYKHSTFSDHFINTFGL